MQNLKVAITPSSFADASPVPMEMLVRAGVEVVPNPYKRRLTEEEAASFLVGVDGLIAGVEPLTRAVLSSAQNLKAIARVGIGVSNVDLAAASEMGIKVSNTPDPPTQAVAELTVTAMLALARRIVQASDALHKGGWPKEISFGLSGKKVLFVGYGRIGRRVRELLRPFGIVALIADPFIEQTSLAEDDTLVDLHNALASADIITLHSSGAQQLLGEDELLRAKRGVLVLNAGRGGLVSEAALARQIASGHVGGAWLDVFEKEPYSGPLQGLPNVLLTPHAGTYTEQCRLRMETEAVANLLRDLGVSGDARS